MAEPQSGITRWILLGAFLLLLMYWWSQTAQHHVLKKQQTIVSPVVEKDMPYSPPEVKIIKASEPNNDPNQIQIQEAIKQDLQRQILQQQALDKKATVATNAASVQAAAAAAEARANGQEEVIPSNTQELTDVQAPVAPNATVSMANPIPTEEQALAQIEFANKQRAELDKAMASRTSQIDKVHQAIVDSGFKNPYNVEPRQIDTPLVDPPADVVQKLKNHELVGH